MKFEIAAKVLSFGAIKELEGHHDNFVGRIFFFFFFFFVSNFVSVTVKYGREYTSRSSVTCGSAVICVGNSPLNKTSHQRELARNRKRVCIAGMECDHSREWGRRGLRFIFVVVQFQYWNVGERAL
jgi:hypothetical protein